MKLIVGLGNPGPQYSQTRHNAGFRVVDKLAAKFGWSWNERRGKAVLASGALGAEKVILAKPQTMMNLSGEAVSDLLRWYKVPLEDVLIVYDELDLPLGKVRLRARGSAGGHNGLSNVILHLHSNEIPRLRIGIGRPTNARMETIRYVLGIPPTNERIQLETSEDQAAQAVELFIVQDLDATMNQVNIDPEARQKAEARRQQPKKLPFQLGINARLFPSNWRPVRQEIPFMRSHGIQYIQLPGPEDGLGETRLGDPLDVVARAFEASRIIPVMEIVLRVNASGLTSSGMRLKDVLQANLPAINTLRCARVHIHAVPTEPRDVATLPQLEERLIPDFRAGLELARAQPQRFRFGVEHNEPAVGLFSTPEHCAMLLEAVPGLGFVWDINHALPEQLAGYLALAPRMSMLHISDTPLPEVNYHLPLGLGSIDLEGYCRSLLERDFHGPAILEIGGLPKSGGYGRDTDEALSDSLDRLRKAIMQASSDPRRASEPSGRTKG